MSLALAVMNLRYLAAAQRLLPGSNIQTLMHATALASACAAGLIVPPHTDQDLQGGRHEQRLSRTLRTCRLYGNTCTSSNTSH